MSQTDITNHGSLNEEYIINNLSTKQLSKTAPARLNSIIRERLNNYQKQKKNKDKKNKDKKNIWYSDDDIFIIEL